MGWSDCDKALAGKFLKLEDDGDSEVVCLCGVPMPRSSEFNGQQRNQALFPVITEEGVKVWAVGATLYRQLKKSWAKVSKAAVKIVRNGAKGDKTTTYDVKPCKCPAALTKAKKALKTADIMEVLTGAASSGDAPDNEETPF